MQSDQQLIGLNLIAVVDAPFEFYVGVELVEYFVDPRAAAHNSSFARDDGCGGGFIRGNQFSGDVAAADIFLERPADGAFDIGAQLIGEFGLGH